MVFEAERKCAGPCTGLLRHSISFLETPGNFPQTLSSMGVLYLGNIYFLLRKTEIKKKKRQNASENVLDKGNLELMMVTFYEVGMSGFLLYDMKKRRQKLEKIRVWSEYAIQCIPLQLELLIYTSNFNLKAMRQEELMFQASLA